MQQYSKLQRGSRRVGGQLDTEVKERARDGGDASGRAARGVWWTGGCRRLALLDGVVVVSELLTGNGLAVTAENEGSGDSNDKVSWVSATVEDESVRRVDKKFRRILCRTKIYLQRIT